MRSASAPVLVSIALGFGVGLFISACTAPAAACSAANCIGCCAGDSCVTLITPAQCGASGSACVACPGGQFCVAGQCTGGMGGGQGGGGVNTTRAQRGQSSS